MKRWEPSTDWRERHTSSELLYAVTVRWPTSQGAEAAWREVAALHREADGEIMGGGAALRRLDGEHIEVISAGEDALDSLEACLDDLLDSASRMGASRPQIVREVREVLE